MDSCLAVSSHRHLVMACGAATAMVDTIRPVQGFSTQFPLASSSLAKRALVLRRGQSTFQNHPPSLLQYGNSSRRLSVSAHLGHLPEPETIQAHVQLAQHMLTNSFLTLADAAATVDGAVDAAGVKHDDGWLGGLTDALEKILIFLKDGLATLKVPYAYGFAIILLTLLVKAATFPLTKQQVESTISMQNLQPQLKAIQTRYQGDQERIQLETARLYKQAGVNPLAGCLPTLATLPVWIGLYRALSNVANGGRLTEGFFWIPSLAGPTTIAARAGGSGIAWLFPFENGVPPLGWSDTIAYLVLPVLLVASQFVSMQIMQPPQSNDPAQKNSQLILKFLPLMIGYFSLSVPSGLSLYWLTNNVLSTAQQVYLRQGKAMAAGDAGTTIITPGQGKRSGPPPAALSSSTTPKEIRSFKEDRRGERFKELKRQEAERKAKQREAAAKAKVGGGDQPLENETSGSAGEDEEEGIIDVSINESEEKLEVYTNGSGDQIGSPAPKRGKRSKRSRAN